MTIWFTSDTHFSHANICSVTSKWPSGGPRLFSSLEEMNKTLVDNINSCVQHNDVLYHLGDWSFGGKDKVKIFRDQINCSNIVFITGNHDHHIIKNDEVANLFSKVVPMLEFSIGKQYIVLNHYAMRVWNHSHHGSWHLYGHSHGSLPSVGKSMDVGIDTCNEIHKKYTPYSFDDIQQILSTHDIKFVDHHSTETN